MIKKILEIIIYSCFIVVIAGCIHQLKEKDQQIQQLKEEVENPVVFVKQLNSYCNNEHCTPAYPPDLTGIQD